MVVMEEDQDLLQNLVQILLEIHQFQRNFVEMVQLELVRMLVGVDSEEEEAYN